MNVFQIKLDLQIQAMNWSWPVGCSLLSPDLEGWCCPYLRCGNCRRTRCAGGREGFSDTHVQFERPVQSQEEMLSGQFAAQEGSPG